MDEASCATLLQRIKTGVAQALEPDGPACSSHSVPTAIAAMLTFNRICADRFAKRAAQNAPRSLLGELQAQNKVVSDALPRLQACTSKLQEAIFSAKALLARPEQQMQPTEECMKEVIVYAHKLSYSSHAPLGKHPQPVYGPFTPPAPTEHHMQFSKLQEFARRQAERAAEAAAAEQARAAAAAAEQLRQQQQRDGGAAAAAGAEAGAPAVSGALAAGWRELTLPARMPENWRPPPGWKPGDPISLDLPPPGVGVSAPLPEAAAAKPADVAAETALPLNVNLDSGIEFDFVLNADAVESDIDDDSDSEMDDDD